MPLQEYPLNLDRTRREIRPHGTLDFPCAAYCSSYSASTYSELPWHWHDEFEVIYIVHGTLHIQIPGKSFYLHEGEVLFINSGILHQGEVIPTCEIKSFLFHPSLISGHEDSVFSQRYIRPLIHFPLLDAFHFTCEKPWHENVLTSILEAFEVMASNQLGYEFIVREKLSKLCLTLYAAYEKDILQNQFIPNQDNLRIQKMLEFIHIHYAEILALSQIAASVGIGERECLRCFKRMIQVSPMQYLLKYRITMGAAFLLRYSHESIAQISMRCGFDSPSNFSQVFKRFFNCTPREYRKEHYN